MSAPHSSPSKHSPASSSRNPVSLRLYKALGASFDDDGTKQALRTLSELYAPASISATPNGKVVDPDSEDSDHDKDEDIDTSTSIPAYLSDSPLPSGTIPGERAARARKHLRRDVENKLTETSHQFLKAFGEVDQQLDTIQEHIAAMKILCNEAESQLEDTNNSCVSLLERAGSLRQERQIIAAKQSIVSIFLSRFTLNDQEVESLVSRDVSVGRRFFDAMDKTEKIRQDCQVLMAGEEGPTQAGLDIMAATSSYLEQAYEKLFRWCSFEFRRMAREVQIEVTPTLREVVSRLGQRSELLTEALGFLSQSRQVTLLNAFTDALTRGGRGGLPRPIELHAHDPMRYVGDMLAWVHQTIAAEREFLDSLFGINSDGRMVGSVRKFDQNSEDEEWIKELMDAALSKLCIPLKARVHQTIRSQESSIMSFKIVNLLQFYMLTMQRTIGEDALLSKTLKEITDISYKAFFDSTAVQGRTLLRTSLDLDDQEVVPPLAIQDHGQVLREIMVVYESSIPENESLEEQNAGFKSIADAMLDPAVQMCLTVSEEKQKARPRWDKLVFVLNCLAYLKSVIEPVSFTLEKQKLIDKLIEENVLSLIDDHYETILRDAGLEEAVTTCATNRNEPLSHLPATQPSQLQLALRKFSNWLSDQEVVHSPRLARLVVQQLHTRIHQAALERLSKSYQQLCEEVRRPSNKYEAASTLLGSERPFGQVRLLWQIFGLQEVAESS